MGPRIKKWLGSQGLGQRSLTTAWLAVATGIYFHKQGRAMFFIPYLSVWSVSFAVFLELEKHANTHPESAGNRNTRRAVLTQTACSGRQRMLDLCLSHLCTRIICMHLSQCYCFFIVWTHCINSDHLDFSHVWVWETLFMFVHVSYCKAVALALPWGWVVTKCVSERETSERYWKDFIMWNMLFP